MAVITFLVILKSNPAIFTPKTKGSFEYVREGEKFLDKGRYKDAIAFFEKAHGSSPENKAIRADLAYAYSKYGSSLGAAGVHDRAIKYFAKAFRVISDAAAAQNLAIGHSKRALANAQMNSFAAAAKDLAEARAIVSGFSMASKNLGISLYNDAVEEYKSGRETAAILLLKESALVYSASEPNELLGDIYYKRTDLERALFYWAKALQQAEGGGRLKEKLGRLSKEMELAGSEEKRAFPYFDIRYGRGVRLDIERANAVMEKAYFDVGRDLDYYPSGKTVIFFYSEYDFGRVFNMPNVVRAFYDGNIRMPFPEKRMDERSLGRYIYHEYAHAIISAKTKNNAPVWFSEGVAVREETKGDEAALKDEIAGLDESYFSIEPLEKNFSAGAVTKKGLRPYYLVSYTVVKYMVDRWGLAGLRDIMKRMADGQHVMNAIDDEFLLSEKDFERGWREYLKKDEIPGDRRQ